MRRNSSLRAVVLKVWCLDNSISITLELGRNVNPLTLPVTELVALGMGPSDPATSVSPALELISMTLRACYLHNPFEWTP